MTNKVQLPAEIYGQIIEDCSLEKKDLLNLCLVAKVLSKEAYRVLYRCVIIKRISRLRRILYTLRSSPDLCTYLYTLIIDLPYNKHWDINYRPIVHAVDEMINLKRLHISMVTKIKGADGNPGYFTWTRELKLPQLESLSLRWNHIGSVKHIFAEITCPLPHLIINGRGVSWNNQLEGVAHIKCPQCPSWDPSKPILRDLLFGTSKSGIS